MLRKIILTGAISILAFTANASDLDPNTRWEVVRTELGYEYRHPNATDSINDMGLVLGCTTIYSFNEDPYWVSIPSFRDIDAEVVRIAPFSFAHKKYFPDFEGKFIVDNEMRRLTLMANKDTMDYLWEVFAKTVRVGFDLYGDGKRYHPPHQPDRTGISRMNINGLLAADLRFFLNTCDEKINETQAKEEAEIQEYLENRSDFEKENSKRWGEKLDRLNNQ